MRKIQARKGPMRIESHTTSLYQTILHRHPRIPAATLELTPRRCRSACKFLTRPFRKLQQAVRINPESLKLNAGQEYSQNTRRSLSGASTLYEDTARPEIRAKPAAKPVMPVP